MNKIKEIRELKKITQEEIARECNISLSSMRNIEKNRSIPNIYVAIKIKNSLKESSVEDIFKLEE